MALDANTYRNGRYEWPTEFYEADVGASRTTNHCSRSDCQGTICYQGRSVGRMIEPIIVALGISVLVFIGIEIIYKYATTKQFLEEE